MMLINETHFYSRSHLTIFEYDLLTANHQFGRLQGAAAIFVRSHLQYSHYIINLTVKCQAAAITLSTDIG